MLSICHSSRIEASKNWKTSKKKIKNVLYSENKRIYLSYIWKLNSKHYVIFLRISKEKRGHNNAVGKTMNINNRNNIKNYC